MKYSLQGLRKVNEGGDHPDRDAQFNHINEQVKALQQAGQPVISVDAKKKELVGEYKNGGREYQPQGKPVPVNVYDFPDKKKGKVTPYGIYDVLRNEGWVNVGQDHDTAAFAVESIRRWFNSEMRKAAYPHVSELLICADGGGSNGSRVRMWKDELVKLAEESGVTIHVCHFPPGTSKWNKIEHKLFSHISGNWRGRTLESHEVIVELIGAVTTKEGLKVQAVRDTNVYQTGIKISDDQMESIKKRIKPAEFHGEWNYSVYPSDIAEVT
jgi:hypothetical protein